MRLATLQWLFAGKHPTGSIVRDGSGFTVWFAHGQRGYDYGGSSVYALAERLGLIPQVDVAAEAVRIVANVAKGDVIAPSGCGDTARWLWTGSGTILSEPAGQDEYNRALARYYVTENDGWSSTIRDG